MIEPDQVPFSSLPIGAAFVPDATVCPDGRIMIGAPIRFYWKTSDAEAHPGGTGLSAAFPPDKMVTIIPGMLLSESQSARTPVPYSPSPFLHFPDGAMVRKDQVLSILPVHDGSAYNETFGWVVVVNMHCEPYIIKTDTPMKTRELLDCLRDQLAVETITVPKTAPVQESVPQ